MAEASQQRLSVVVGCWALFSDDLGESSWVRMKTHCRAPPIYTWFHEDVDSAPWCSVIGSSSSDVIILCSLLLCWALRQKPGKQAARRLENFLPLKQCTVNFDASFTARYVRFVTWVDRYMYLNETRISMGVLRAKKLEARGSKLTKASKPMQIRHLQSCFLSYFFFQTECPPR